MFDRIHILLLLEIFLLKNDLQKFSKRTRTDFSAVVIDYGSKAVDLSDFISTMHFFACTDDEEFSKIIFKFTSYVGKFYKRLAYFK